MFRVFEVSSAPLSKDTVTSLSPLLRTYSRSESAFLDITEDQGRQTDPHPPPLMWWSSGDERLQSSLLFLLQPGQESG